MSDIHGAGQLAALMEDAGYRCCATPDDIHKYLAKYEPLTENIVAQVLAMMARTMKGLDNGLHKGDQVWLDIAIVPYFSGIVYCLLAMVAPSDVR